METLFQRHTGWIEVICGSMFSGKTEELIRRVGPEEFLRLKAEAERAERARGLNGGGSTGGF